MANVTSICEKFEELTQNAANPEDLLRQVLDILQTQAGIRGYFCKIWGRRWSFWIGNDLLTFAAEKMQLSPTLGFCYEEDKQGLSAEDRQVILQCLKNRLGKLAVD
jgi:hypothetical protein